MKRLRSVATGDRVFPHVDFRVFLPGNKKFTRKRVYPAPGNGFTAAHVLKQLVLFSEYLKKEMPAHDWRCVPIGPATFNFVWAGQRAAEETTS